MMMSTLLANLQFLPIFAPKSRNKTDRSGGNKTQMILAKVPQMILMRSSIGVQTVRRVGGAASIAFD